MPFVRLYAATLFAVVPCRVDAQPLAQRLDSAMRAAEARGFSGVVRVERSGTLLLEKGYGLANRSTKTAFTPGTVVQIGSNTKDFTVVAIHQLQLAGRLSVRDSIGKYFTGAPSDKRGITIQQLLDHRAGFPQGLGGDFERVSRKQLVDSAMRFKLLFTPGARESYSNTGYSLLAAIIEQVTGKSYDVYVRDSILAPLQLRRTGFLLPKFKLGQLAHGYTPNGHDEGTMLEKPHAADGPHWNLRGNGGMLSTVGDMHTFYHALFETERLLPARVRDTRFNPNEPIGLAGGDGINMFLFERDPIARTEMIIASTNAAMKASAIRRELGTILGLPQPNIDDDAPARRSGGTPASAAMALVLNRLVGVINGGDAAALRTFIVEQFVTGPGAPSVDARVERISGLHDRLGLLTIERTEVFDDGPAEISLTSAVQGRAVLRVVIDRAAPYKIHGLQIQVGGGD